MFGILLPVLTEVGMAVLLEQIDRNIEIRICKRYASAAVTLGIADGERL